MSLLEVQDLAVAYNGMLALKGVTVCVHPQEVVTVIGANGAGKSTLLKAIVGQVPARDGTIRFDGEDMRGLRPSQRIDRGIVLCPEGRRLFPEMTVAENIRIGAYRTRDKAAFARRLEMLHVMFPRLAERGRQQAASLSGGEQQMVAIARAMMGRPRLLLLDEPTLGLAPKMIHEVAKLVTAISREGIAVILVEQNARLALRISDRGYVLETGSVSLAGSCSELLASGQVQQAYLGAGSH